MEDILNKIRKLLSLADNNDNEHQAAAASQKVMELMERHNLDLSMLDAAKPDGTRDDRKLKGGLYGWQRKLWESSADLNFCKYWSIRGLKEGSSYEHRILGREVNVVSTTILAEYLQNTVERMARREARRTNHNMFARSMIAYREGIATRLVERLAAKRREKMAEEQRRKDEWAKQHSTGTSLTQIDVAHAEEDYNNDFLYGYPPGTSAKRRAENDASIARWREEQRIKNEAHLKRYAEDPKYKAEVDRINKLQQEKDEAWWADYQRKNANRKQRYRQETPEEARRRLHTFEAGYRDGEKVGLDQQVDRRNDPALR